MSLANTSQVLLRNSDVLNATSPLFINLPADEFITEYIDLYAQANITCLNTEFDTHQALKSRYGKTISAVFTSHYTSEVKHDLVIIHFPKSKAELAFTFAMIAPLLTENAPVLLVGDNKGGVKSSEKLSKDFLNHCKKIDSARHCSLFLGDFNNQCKAFVLTDWFKQYQVTIDGITLEIASLPGVFSQDGLDIGTRLLLNNLPKEMKNKVLDFGCGAGVISSFIGKKHPQTKLSLLDVNALALSSAEKTLALNGLSGEVFPSDGLSHVQGTFNHVVSNPPFHQGVKTNYQATETFLSDIKKIINTAGNITIVANSFLRYLPIMEIKIGPTKIQAKQQGFTIYQA
jgi:16S rRNA (guanine1207-N2)-methyltransferase